MKQADSPGNRQTRFVFRILSGIVAAIMLLVSLPVAVFDAWHGSPFAVFAAACCVYAGIGLAIGAVTGRWYNLPA